MNGVRCNYSNVTGAHFCVVVVLIMIETQWRQKVVAPTCDIPKVAFGW